MGVTLWHHPRRRNSVLFGGPPTLGDNNLGVALGRVHLRLEVAFSNSEGQLSYLFKCRRVEFAWARFITGTVRRAK